MVTNIKSRRFELLDHVIKVEEKYGAKKYFESEPEGRRILKRNRLRWLEDVEND
jgi:hypothetical protein